jgi:hypothetical protein
MVLVLSVIEEIPSTKELSMTPNQPQFQPGLFLKDYSTDRRVAGRKLSKVYANSLTIKSLII